MKTANPNEWEITMTNVTDNGHVAIKAMQMPQFQINIANNEDDRNVTVTSDKLVNAYVDPEDADFYKADFDVKVAEGFQLTPVSVVVGTNTADSSRYAVSIEDGKVSVKIARRTTTAKPGDVNAVHWGSGAQVTPLGWKPAATPVQIDLNLRASAVVTLNPDADGRFTASSYTAVADENGTAVFTLTMPTNYEITNQKADGFTARRASDGSVIITVPNVTEPKTLTLELNPLTESAYTVEAKHSGWLVDADDGNLFGTWNGTTATATKKVELPYGQIDWYLYGEAGAVLTAKVMDPGENREIDDFVTIEYDGIVERSHSAGIFREIRWHVSIRNLTENIHILFDKETLFEVGYGEYNGVNNLMATVNKGPYEGVRLHADESRYVIEEGEIAAKWIKITGAVPSMHGEDVTTGDTINFVILVKNGYEIKRCENYDGSDFAEVSVESEPFGNGQWPGHSTAEYHAVNITVRNAEKVATMTGDILLTAGPVA